MRCSVIGSVPMADMPTECGCVATRRSSGTLPWGAGPVHQLGEGRAVAPVEHENLAAPGGLYQRWRGAAFVLLVWFPNEAGFVHLVVRQLHHRWLGKAIPRRASAHLAMANLYCARPALRLPCRITCDKYSYRNSLI